MSSNLFSRLQTQSESCSLVSFCRMTRMAWLYWILISTRFCPGQLQPNMMLIPWGTKQLWIWILEQSVTITHSQMVEVTYWQCLDVSASDGWHLSSEWLHLSIIHDVCLFYLYNENINQKCLINNEKGMQERSKLAVNNTVIDFIDFIDLPVLFK